MPPRPTNVGAAAVVGCWPVVNGLPKIPPVVVGANEPPSRILELKGCAVDVVVVVLKLRLAAVVVSGLLNENAPVPDPRVPTPVVPKAGGAVVGAVVKGLEKLKVGATVAVAPPNAGAAAGAPKVDVPPPRLPKAGAAAVLPKAGAVDAGAPKVEPVAPVPNAGVEPRPLNAGVLVGAPKAGAAAVAPNAGAADVAPNAGVAVAAPNAGVAVAAPNAGVVVVLPNVGRVRPPLIGATAAEAGEPKLSVGAVLAAVGAKLKLGAAAPTTAPAAPARLEVAVAAPNAGGGALVAGRAPKLKAPVAGAAVLAPKPVFVVGVPNEKDIV